MRRGLTNKRGKSEDRHLSPAADVHTGQEPQHHKRLLSMRNKRDTNRGDRGVRGSRERGLEDERGVITHVALPRTTADNQRSTDRAPARAAVQSRRRRNQQRKGLTKAHMEKGRLRHVQRRLDKTNHKQCATDDAYTRTNTSIR